MTSVALHYVVGPIKATLPDTCPTCGKSFLLGAADRTDLFETDLESRMSEIALSRDQPGEIVSIDQVDLIDAKVSDFHCACGWSLSRHTAPEDAQLEHLRRLRSEIDAEIATLTRAKP